MEEKSEERNEFLKDLEFIRNLIPKLGGQIPTAERLKLVLTEEEFKRVDSITDKISTMFGDQPINVQIDFTEDNNDFIYRLLLGGMFDNDKEVFDKEYNELIKYYTELEDYEKCGELKKHRDNLQ